jgi:hypothetical protein
MGISTGVLRTAGMMNGLRGMGLGFALLIYFYWLEGRGAGNVKALAALGAWLGPRQTLVFFIYMALSGLPVIIFFLWRRGLLLSKIKRLGPFLMNWVPPRANVDKGGLQEVFQLPDVTGPIMVDQCRYCPFVLRQIGVEDFSEFLPVVGG